VSHFTFQTKFWNCLHNLFCSFTFSCHARQVKNDAPDKNGYPDPPGRCWVWDWQPHTIKKFVKQLSKMPQMELISGRRGYMEKDLKCGTWHVQTLFKTTALICLLFQLKQYRLSVTALQETRLQQEGCNGY
jgi:hypothetical protein